MIGREQVATHVHAPNARLAATWIARAGLAFVCALGFGTGSSVLVACSDDGVTPDCSDPETPCGPGIIDTDASSDDDEGGSTLPETSTNKDGGTDASDASDKG